MESRNYRFAVIGGMANQHWGTTRITHDVEFKVLVPELDYATIRDALRTDFPERGRPGAPLSPLVVDVVINETTVDFLLAIPGCDEQVVNRAVQCELEGLSTWLCSAEDLIIQKAVGGRGRDWQDIEGILIEQRGRLDLAYLEDWLSQFAELLERPEILSQYEEIQAHIAAVVAELNGE